MRQRIALVAAAGTMLCLAVAARAQQMPASTQASGAPAGQTSPAPDSLEQKRIGGQQPDDSGNDSGGWLRTLASLALVAGLIILAGWLTRRFSGGRFSAAPAAAAQVLWRGHVGPRQHLMIVRFGRRLLLVGAAGGAMSTLAELTDEQEIQQVLQALPEGGLASLLGRRRQSPAGGDAQEPQP